MMETNSENLINNIKEFTNSIDSPFYKKIFPYSRKLDKDEVIYKQEVNDE